MNRETIQQEVLTLIERSGFGGDATVSYDEKSDTLWFSIGSGSARMLLARDGEALIALNHVATKIAEKLQASAEERFRVVIDANDFERRKIENLRTVAHMMAERARYFKSSVDVEPMLPHERRVVHEFLADAPDVQTESAGEGALRHVVIRYVDPKVE